MGWYRRKGARAKRGGQKRQGKGKGIKKKKKERRWKAGRERREVCRKEEGKWKVEEVGECCVKKRKNTQLIRIDFTFNRLCMKLFKTGSIDIVKDCQSCFAIDL